MGVELSTERLQLGHLTLDDADFIYRLLNEPSFVEFIGDKQVGTLDDARGYLQAVVLTHYAQHDFGVLRVELRQSGTPIGLCGLVKRDELPDPDLGFAFLRQYWSNGYALESSRAVLQFAARQLGLRRIVAMADPENLASIRLLGKLGFQYEQMVTMPGETCEVRQYACEP